MIVDMVRNDLGRIAETGSVQVPELFKVEKYTTLFQMTSLVQAKTQASITEIFSALFPCASITGAPKVSTMKIIAELEATPRKIYTGSIGTFAPNRKAQFNVAIRTVLINQYAKTAEYGIGGGITWDSTSADEYDEALLKARVLTESHRDFLLLETLLWTPQEGYFLLEKHLKRISDSAQYFDIHFSRPLLMDLLDKIQEEFSSPQRVRITLDFANNFRAEMKDYLEQGNSLKVKLANEPINSSDLYYFHKTTRREIYPKLEGFDDILLYNERGELTEFTIGNLVVELNGELITPPISCGLLAGTFRAHLLETNAVREQVIHKDDIKNCTKVFFINSVRKWMEVQI
jgi:para-aminobenzoate synthetase/4-amino-4-deoxychorismate lyase